MIFIGIFFILFGCLIIAMPELIGVNITILGYRMQKVKNSAPSSGFSFGGYEIIKKR